MVHVCVPPSVDTTEQTIEEAPSLAVVVKNRLDDGEKGGTSNIRRRALSLICQLIWNSYSKVSYGGLEARRIE